MAGDNHANYRPEIDGLRAIAVLLVVVFHAHATWLPGGFIGVDVFFVISGFLITGILLREMGAGDYSIRRFYVRRIRRVFPALLTVLLSCLIAGWLLLIPKEYEALGTHLTAASLFYSNFKLWGEAGYFDTTAELKPLLHLWSLGVEEQFYILWPLVLLAATRMRRVLLPLMLGITAVSLLLALTRSASHPIASFFLPHTRFWELMAGAMLAYFASHIAKLRSPTRSEIAAWTGLTLIIFAALFFTKLDSYPGWRAIFPVLGSMLLLGSSGSTLHRYFLSHRLMVGIGLISYPLYLWHWPLLAFARILYWQAPLVEVILILVVLSFALAYATYHYIEMPIRFGRGRQRSVAPLLMAMALIGITGAVIESTDGFKKLRASDTRFQDLVKAHDFTQHTTPCTDAINARGNWCFTARTAKIDAAIYGDSHADHLFPGLATHDATRNWLLLGYSSCPPLQGIRSHLRNEADECLAHTDRALALLTEHPEIRTVVLSSLGAFYVSGSISPQHQGALSSDNWVLESIRSDEAKLPRPELFYRGMARTIRALEASGKQVVIFSDVPSMDFWSVSCLPRLGAWSQRLGMSKSPCGIARAKVDAENKIYDGILARLVKTYPRTRLFNSRDVLCDAQLCHAANDDLLFYSDSHHLSMRGSGMMAQHFLPWLNAHATNTGSTSAATP